MTTSSKSHYFAPSSAFNLVTGILVCVFLLFSEYFFFRNVLFTSQLLSEPIDGRLCMLVTEHWWQFLQGHEKFNELAMFYPHKNVLSYTDMFFLFGMIHSFFRMLSFDMFDAFKYTLVLVHLVGTFACFYFCFKKLKISVIWSLFATVAFSFSHTYALFCMHPQLIAVSLLPVMAIFLFDFFNSYLNGKINNRSAYLFITSFALLISNSWYIAFFLVLFTLIFTVIFLFLLFIYRIRFDFILTFIKKMWPHLIRYALCAFILLLPFIFVYLPTIHTVGGYDNEETFYYMPKLIDLIAPNTYNFIPTALSQKLSDIGTSVSAEIKAGFSLVLLTLFACTFIISVFKIKPCKSKQNKIIGTLIQSLFWAIIVFLILPVQLNADKDSLWAFVHHFVPGGSAIRCISRLWFWISFPMSVLTAYMANKYLKLPQTLKLTLSLSLLAALWVSNISENGIFSKFNKEQEIEFISRIAPPPADAEVFVFPFEFDENFLTPPITLTFERFHSQTFLHHIDAFVIASHFRIKTINGHSGVFPNGWDMSFPAYYFQFLKKYIEDNNLKNVYVYDKIHNKWMTYKAYLTDLRQYKLGDTVTFGFNQNARYYLNGPFSFNQLSETNQTRLQLLLTELPETDLLLQVNAEPFLNQKILTEVFVNNTLVDTWIIDKYGTYTAVIPKYLLQSKDVRLLFDTSKTIDINNSTTHDNLFILKFHNLSLSEF